MHITYFESLIILFGRLESSGLTQPLHPYSFYGEFQKKISCIAYPAISKQIPLHH